MSAVAVSGCIPTGPGTTDPATWPAQPTTEPTASSTQVPAPDCPTVSEASDPASVAIDSHRYGAICTGMTLAQAGDAVPVLRLAPDAACPWIATIVDADALTVRAVTHPDEPDGPVRYFRLQYLDDPVTAPPHEVPATAEGVAIGSSSTDILLAYPAARAVTQRDPAGRPHEQWVVEEAPEHWYVFDMAQDVVAQMTWGTGLEGGHAGDLCPP